MSYQAFFLYGVLFFSGFAGLGYELSWTRMLAVGLGYEISAVLAVVSAFFCGLALGAWVFDRVKVSQTHPGTVYSVLEAVIGIWALVLIVLIPISNRLFAVILGQEFSPVYQWLASLVFPFLLFLPATLSMGATLPVMHRVLKTLGEKKKVIGGLYAANTFGAVAGTIAVVLLLVPRFGHSITLAILAGRRIFLPALIPIGGCLIIIFSQSPMQLVSLEPGDQIIEHREEVMAAVTVIQDETGERHLKVNDRFQEGGTSSVFSDWRQGHIPLLLHPRPERALFLGLGTGSTLAAAADHPGLRAEGVELIPEVIGMFPHFEKATGNLKGYPSLRLIPADARRFVNARPGAYDVIVADLFHPARDGAGSLYTLEHFQAIRALLRPEGVFVQWLPLYQLDLDTLRLITRTFLKPFPEGTAFLAHYSLKAPIVGLAARIGEGGYHEGWFQERVQDPGLAEALRRVHLYDDFSLFGNFLAGNDELKRFAGAGLLNTDDRPLVTFQAPRFVYENQEPAEERLMTLIRTFHPRPEEVLIRAEGGMGEDYRRRLADYWTARNRFIQAGIGVNETRDLRELLAVVKEPLLSIVRQSRDFEAAYNPLLGMAQALYRIDPPAAERLLLDLEKANPYRDEARRLRQSFSSLVNRRGE